MAYDGPRLSEDFSAVGETRRESKSVYSSIRKSFTSKFSSSSNKATGSSSSSSSLLEVNAQNSGGGAAAGGSSGNARAMINKLDAKKDEEGGNTEKSEKAALASVSPEDLQEMRSLIAEGKDPDTRRSALLGLFKMSLRDGLEVAMVKEGAAEICLEGMKAEAKGSGARRAGLQALRNFTAHPLNKKKMLFLAPALVAVVEEEAPGSGPREAALECLLNLASEKANRAELAAVPKMMQVVLTASQNETGTGGGREAAMNLIEKLSEYANKSGGSSSSSSGGTRGSVTGGTGSTTAEDELKEGVELKSLVEACVETLSKEKNGSGARTSAMRTLRNLAKNLSTHSTMMSIEGFTDRVLTVVKDESPGSETRSLVFLLFAELALSPENRLPLMKTRDLADVVIAAVRDEAPQSPAREGAMYTVARLCIHPGNRPTFMAAEGLVPTCVRAAQQEPKVSGGRAAALEMLAGLALAGKKSQSQLFATKGLVQMAVEGAACRGGGEEGGEDTSAPSQSRSAKGMAVRAEAAIANRMREAGLDLIASLALDSDNRGPLMKTKGLLEAVVSTACASYERPGAPERAAALAAARALCEGGTSEISTAFRKEKGFLDAVIGGVVDEEFATRARGEAMGILVLLYAETLEDITKWADNSKMPDALLSSINYEAPGSEPRLWAFTLATRSIRVGVGRFLSEPENMRSLVELCETVARETLAAPEQLGGDDFRRVSLRRAPRARSTRDLKSEPETLAAMQRDRSLALEAVDSVYGSSKGSKVPLSTAVAEALLQMCSGTGNVTVSLKQGLRCARVLCRAWVERSTSQQEADTRASTLFAGVASSLFKVLGGDATGDLDEDDEDEEGGNEGAPPPPGEKSGKGKKSATSKTSLVVRDDVELLALEILATLSSYELAASSVTKLDDARFEGFIKYVVASTDSFASPTAPFPTRKLLSLLISLTNLLFYPTFSSKLKIAESRGPLEKALTRAVEAGCDGAGSSEEDNDRYNAARLAQAVALSLRLLGSDRTGKRKAEVVAKSRKVGVLFNLDLRGNPTGPEFASKLGEALKKKSTKQMTIDPVVMDAPMKQVNSKKRRTVVVDTLESLEVCDAVVVMACANMMARDPVVRLYASLISVVDRVVLVWQPEREREGVTGSASARTWMKSASLFSSPNVKLRTVEAGKAELSAVVEDVYKAVVS